jgi:ribonucleoside-diphosphate reductase alpha chain
MDQALSRNMYLETRDIDETMAIYATAWAKGLKSTYYLHMKPRHTAEQSTIKVNKAEKMGKRGFATVFEEGAPVREEVFAAVVAPVVAAAPTLASEMIPPKVTVSIAKAQVPQELHITPALAPMVEEIEVTHATGKPLPTPNIIPSGSTANIMPPSDPMLDTICDSCQ